jgi:hypothetical protein
MNNNLTIVASYFLVAMLTYAQETAADADSIPASNSQSMQTATVSTTNKNPSAIQSKDTRNVRFTFSLSYGYTFGQYNNSVGPVLSFGLIVKDKVYIGIDPTLTAFEAIHSSQEGTCYLIGLGAACMGVYKPNDMFFVQYGGTVGYWFEHSGYTDSFNQETNNDATYFGGTKMKMGIGYKKVFAVFSLINLTGLHKSGGFAYATPISFGLQCVF